MNPHPAPRMTRTRINKKSNLDQLVQGLRRQNSVDLLYDDSINDNKFQSAYGFTQLP